MTTQIHPPKAPSAFRRWRAARPFWGGLLVVLSGLELLLAVKAPLPVVLHVGMQGLVGYLLPLVLVLCGVLLLTNPDQRLFYSLIAALCSLASWATDNLGGFVVGMLLGLVGSALAFAWTPDGKTKPPATRAAASDEDPTVYGDLGVFGDRADHDDPADRRDPADHGDTAVFDGPAAFEDPAGDKDKNKDTAEYAPRHE